MIQITNARHFRTVQEQFGSFDAFVQATGVVNDHLVSCYRHRSMGSE